MGTIQSAINVRCCTIKQEDDVLSDEGEAEGAPEKGAVCVVRPLPWDSGASGSAPVQAPSRVGNLPRTMSNTTTLPG